MEIILKEDVIGLGYKNDIVNVKNGYGRNYLIPTGKAVIASASAKKVLAENLKQQAHKLAAILAAAEKEAEALNGAGSIGILIKLNRKPSRLRLSMAGHVIAERPVDYKDSEHSNLVTQEFSSHHWEQQKSLEISSLWSSATADKEPRTGRLEGSRKSTGGTQLMFI
jgi:ribosomal protein L9